MCPDLKEIKKCMVRLWYGVLQTKVKLRAIATYYLKLLSPMVSPYWLDNLNSNVCLIRVVYEYSV